MCPSKELPSDDWEELIATSGKNDDLDSTFQAKAVAVSGFMDVDHPSSPLMKSSEKVEKKTGGIRMELSHLGTLLRLMMNPTEARAKELEHEKRVKEVDPEKALSAGYGRLIHELDSLISAKLWMQRVPTIQREKAVREMFPTFNPDKEEFRVLNNLLMDTDPLKRGSTFVEGARKLRKAHTKKRLEEREYVQSSWLSVRSPQENFWYWKALENPHYEVMSESLFRAWQEVLDHPKENVDRKGAKRVMTMREVMIVDNQTAGRDEEGSNVQITTQLDGISVWRLGEGKNQKIMVDVSDLKTGLGYDPKDPIGKWVAGMEMMLMSQTAYRFARGYAAYRQAQFGYRSEPRGFKMTPDAVIITRQMSRADWSDRVYEMSWRRLDVAKGIFVFEKLEDVGIEQEEFMKIYKDLRRFMSKDKKLVRMAMGRGKK